MSLPSFVYGPGPAPGYGRATIEGLDIGNNHHQRHFSHEHHAVSGPSSPAIASPGPAHMYPGPSQQLHHQQQLSPLHSQPFTSVPPPGTMPKMGVFHEPVPVAATVVSERAPRGGRRGVTRKQAGSQRGMTIAASLSIPSPPSAGPSAAPNRKPAARDSKRRATHSQIERRRREKINDRLITLRNLVPACAREVEERKRKAAGLDADGTPLEATVGEDGKRKRVRRKNVQQPKEDPNAEEELGLHKLEVLTHAIDYIYELQAKIEELQTGTKPALLRRASDADRDRERAAAAAVSLESTATPTAPTQVAVEDDEDDELEMDEWKGSQQISTASVKEAEYTQNSSWDPRAATSTSGRFSLSSTSGLPARPAASPSPPSSVLPLKADPMVSSFRASRRSSPSVMSLTADSPMLSPFAGALLAHSSLTMPSPLTVPTVAPGSSGSAFTQLTSPVMSLGAESPIFKAGNGGADATAASSSSVAQSGTRRASIIGGKQAWPMLPSSALPLPTPAGASSSSTTVRKRDPTSSSATGPETKRPKREPGHDSPSESNSSSSSSSPASVVPAPPAQSDAELLLSFSTSPEALRPLSAVREGFDAAAAKTAGSRLRNKGGAVVASKMETVGGTSAAELAASKTQRRSRVGSLETPVSAIRVDGGASTASRTITDTSPAVPSKGAEGSANEGQQNGSTSSAKVEASPTTGPSSESAHDSPPHLALDGSSSSSSRNAGGAEGKGEASSCDDAEADGKETDDRAAGIDGLRDAADERS